MRKTLFLSLLCVLVLALAPPAGAAQKNCAFESVLETADPNARYLFYIHGRLIERMGIDAVSQWHGKYEYSKILKRLRHQGFVVISEVRGDTVPAEYAVTVGDRIKELLAAGVPPEHITVAGFSKGGQIALLTAAYLEEPEINYVIMAGCGGEAVAKRQKAFYLRLGEKLSGRILSIYDDADKESGTCKVAMDAGDERVQGHEVVTQTGKGHGLFFRPDPVWLNALSSWGKRAGSE